MKSLRTIFPVIALAAGMTLFIDGCRREPAKLLPPSADRDWVEQPFEKVKIVRKEDGAVIADVWVRQLSPQESSILNYMDDVLVHSDGQPLKKYRVLPRFAHQPRSGEAFRIGQYNLIDSGEHVIDTLELD